MKQRIFASLICSVFCLVFASELNAQGSPETEWVVVYVNIHDGTQEESAGFNSQSAAQAWSEFILPGGAKTIRIFERPVNTGAWIPELSDMFNNYLTSVDVASTLPTTGAPDWSKLIPSPLKDYGSNVVDAYERVKTFGPQLITMNEELTNKVLGEVNKQVDQYNKSVAEFQAQPGSGKVGMAFPKMSSVTPDRVQSIKNRSELEKKHVAVRDEFVEISDEFGTLFKDRSDLIEQRESNSSSLAMIDTEIQSTRKSLSGSPLIGGTSWNSQGARLEFQGEGDSGSVRYEKPNSYEGTASQDGTWRLDNNAIQVHLNSFGTPGISSYVSPSDMRLEITQNGQLSWGGRVFGGGQIKYSTPSNSGETEAKLSKLESEKSEIEARVKERSEQVKQYRSRLQSYNERKTKYNKDLSAMKGLRSKLMSSAYRVPQMGPRTKPPTRSGSGLPRTPPPK